MHTSRLSDGLAKLRILTSPCPMPCNRSCKPNICKLRQYLRSIHHVSHSHITQAANDWAPQQRQSASSLTMPWSFSTPVSLLSDESLRPATYILYSSLLSCTTGLDFCCTAVCLAASPSTSDPHAAAKLQAISPELPWTHARRWPVYTCRTHLQLAAHAHTAETVLTPEVSTPHNTSRIDLGCGRL